MCIYVTYIFYKLCDVNSCAREARIHEGILRNNCLTQPHFEVLLTYHVLSLLCGKNNVLLLPYSSSQFTEHSHLHHLGRSLQRPFLPLPDVETIRQITKNRKVDLTARLPVRSTQWLYLRQVFKVGLYMPVWKTTSPLTIVLLRDNVFWVLTFKI